jgi:hypothetical protein
MNTPALELADIVRCHGADFLAEYGGSLTDAQKKALRDVAACRTAVLGGQLWQCLDCGQAHAVYHSCRNRHCPKCQAQSRAHWLAQQLETLLPVEYFHVVFTLPQEVAAVALANPVTVYNLLFQAARETLLEVAADPKHLGALPLSGMGFFTRSIEQGTVIGEAVPAKVPAATDPGAIARV